MAGIEYANVKSFIDEKSVSFEMMQYLPGIESALPLRVHFNVDLGLFEIW